jgi:hypothetical protein
MKLNAEEALDLSNELLADLELERIPLSSCIMKAARLARLTGDTKHLKIFEYELSGYPKAPTGVTAEVWALCKAAGRTYVVEEDINGEKKLSEKANTNSITTIEENAETLRIRLSFFQPQPINISSANPNQFVGAPVRDHRSESMMAISYRDEKSILAARRSFIYSYVLSKYFELRVSSAAEDIFEIYRRKVDNLLGAIIPEELRRLDSIKDNLRSSNSEDWANAAHSCRRLLQAVADALYPPTDKKIKIGSGKEIKAGKDNYINRLVLFCEERILSGTSCSVISADLQFIGERLDAIFSAVQKGSHAEIKKSEAQRFVIHTYLVIGDILELNYDTSSDEVINNVEKNASS